MGSSQVYKSANRVALRTENGMVTQHDSAVASIKNRYGELNVYIR